MHFEAILPGICPRATLGERWVQRYRAYTVDPDGSYCGVHELDCADDAEAIAHTEQLVDGHDIELWDRGRFLKRFARKTTPPSFDQL
jgi:hypothetical protein